MISNAQLCINFDGVFFLTRHIISTRRNCSTMRYLWTTFLDDLEYVITFLCKCALSVTGSVTLSVIHVYIHLYTISEFRAALLKSLRCANVMELDKHRDPTHILHDGTSRTLEWAIYIAIS